nr:hypothetical protein [uncultured Flavobacterium sp.]
MKIIATIFVLSLFIVSCSSSHFKSCEPINVFLEYKKLDKNKEYILVRDKESNKQALRIFNGNEGPKHMVDPTGIDYTSAFFVEKHWKKIYDQYANDTIKKYWSKEDFPQYKFILENRKDILKHDFLIRYRNKPIWEIIIISEPMYYMNKKYIMFSYNVMQLDHSNQPQVVIMKRVKKKWVVVKTIGDYIFS